MKDAQYKAASAKTLAEALEIAYMGAVYVFCAKDYREGIAAFLDKRRPEFNK